MSEETELRGENAAFDTETATFLRRARSVRSENGRKLENTEKFWGFNRGCVVRIEEKCGTLGGPKLGFQGEVRGGIWTV